MAKAYKITGVAPRRSYHENARIILPQKVEEVYSWEPFIWEAARREELHNMRISIKRLRYTMELFRVAYRNSSEQSAVSSQQESLVTESNTQLLYAESQQPITDSQYAEFLAVIVDLQEILGDIHDADVVLEVLANYTSQSGNQQEQDAALPGVAKLIARTKKTREADYETFLEKWKQLSATGFKEKLLSFLTS